MYSLGIDVSEWDLRPLDWKQASAKIDFVFIKISQGTEEDPLFRAQWEAARGWVLRSAYHFLDPDVAPKTAADKMLDIYKSVSLAEMPPTLDLEIGPPSTILNAARYWLEYWEDRTGIRPILYTSPGFLDTIGARSAHWLRDYTLWESVWYYDKISDDLRAKRILQVMTGEVIPAWPAPPAPYGTPAPFWQWTSRGDPATIPGYYLGPGHKKAVDLNFFRGSREDLWRQYGKPRELPENGDNLYKYSITPLKSDGLRVRSDHYAVDSPIPNRIGSLAFGRFAFGDEKWIAPVSGTNYKAGDTWLRVKSVDGVLLDGWIAAIHNGVAYARIDIIGTEDPDPPPAGETVVDIRVSLSPITPGLDVTGTIDISSPGHASQKTTFRLPPV
jgi:GH25 family lysozyme M1 (1,4-beta-N-acetylmuramidase)